MRPSFCTAARAARPGSGPWSGGPGWPAGCGAAVASRVRKAAAQAGMAMHGRRWRAEIVAALDIEPPQAGDAGPDLTPRDGANRVYDTRVERRRNPELAAAPDDLTIEEVHRRLPAAFDGNEHGGAQAAKLRADSQEQRVLGHQRR